MKDLEKDMATEPQMTYTSDMRICCTSKLKLAGLHGLRLCALFHPKENVAQKAPRQALLLSFERIAFLNAFLARNHLLPL